MRESEDVARIWMRQAAYDLESTRLMMREGFYSQVCFMSSRLRRKLSRRSRIIEVIVMQEAIR